MVQHSICANSTNRVLYHQVTNGQGFMSDQTNSWIVGLDENEIVKNLEVKLINNKKINLGTVEKNKVLFLNSSF